uniref:Uncharacterized protein n=1 Tax=Tanacetum cinerariifolium TaxID=118510 RepID=A0A6L2K4V6_TANCI|nr:hypothetical protein [Tanacetum cinerariifolium]
MENLNLFYQDIRISSSISRHLTQKEVAKEALAHRISQKFALLEEVRPVLETMAYHDKYKNVLDKIYKDKVELDGMIMKEDEEAINKVKGEALKEKDDPRAFIFPIKFEGKVNKNALADTGSDINTMPYQICEQLGREEIKKVDRWITMINHTQAEAVGMLTNVLCQVGVTTLIAKFLILDIPIDRDALIVHVNWKPDYKGCYTKEEEATGHWRTEIRVTDPPWEETMTKPDHQDQNAQFETVEEVLLPQVHHEFLLWDRCNRDVKSRYNIRLAKLLPRHIYSPCVMNWDVLNIMGCDGEINNMLRIRLQEAGSNEEIFISMAWIRAFNINEPIYLELCHKFYSNYEFDKVCVNDELQTKKIIKFRLGGRAHNLTLLEFAHRLGLYHAEKLDEEGFDRTSRYDKVQKNDLWLLSMFDARHQNRYTNVAWLIARWMKRKGAGTQKESQICFGQFISKLARKARVLSDEVLRSLSALKELIDPEGRLILEDPQPRVPRVGIPRPPRASMQDLYDRMGSMEIRQEAIERMEYRQSYHWDRYQGVFEHMTGIYNVSLQRAYNPPSYAQP